MRSLRSFLAAKLVLGVSVLAVACGGGGGLSLEEYFQQADEIFADRDDQAQALQEEAFPEDASEEEIAGHLRESFQGLAQIAADFGTALQGVRPPAEAEDAHNGLVAAVEPIPALFESIATDVPETLSLEESEQYDPFPGGEGTEPLIALDQACAALQQVADDNDIDVDLECGQEE